MNRWCSCSESESMMAFYIRLIVNSKPEMIMNNVWKISQYKSQVLIVFKDVNYGTFVFEEKHITYVCDNSLKLRRTTKNKTKNPGTSRNKTKAEQ